MSGLLGVRLLLLWGCACLWLSSSASGALVISRHNEAIQERRGAARSLQRRSTNEAMVEVYSVTVDCTVTSRFAHTVMTSKAFNKANSSQEILFEVELPKTAFITNFSMEIEGQVYVGEVKEKEKAKKQYEKAVSSGQTAGLVKASGRKMEKFSVSVNIAAESNVTFVLTYEELLQRKLGRYELLTRVKPKTLVQDFQIVTNIYEPQGISYVDAHATFLSNELLPLVEKTVTDRKAHISFSPTMEQQRKCPGCDGTLIDGDFIVSYDVKREKNLGDIQIVNGYFVHFFAPELPKLPKNVVFVIDISGSMSGRKIVQTREAMLAILQQVHEDDHFAIVRFDSVIETWKDSLTKATKENIIEAMDYIRRIDSRGWTNINDAVLKAVNMLVKDRQMERLPERSADMIILLTDGMPSVGERDIGKIQENVRTAIGGNMSLYCLGFGNDVDYSFLDVMSRQNKGLARRIFEASDAVVQLQGFYDEVASPLLLEVDMHYPDNAVDSLTISHFSQFFNGTEIVVAGHLMDNDLDNFLVEVVGRGLEEDFRVQGQVSAADWDVFYPDEEYIFGDFTERLWAYLTIQQLLDKSKSGTPDEKASTTAKALDMSLQYSFVTPLTSMVVTKPETEDSPSSTLIADKLTEEERQQAEKITYNYISVQSYPRHYQPAHDYFEQEWQDEEMDYGYILEQSYPRSRSINFTMGNAVAFSDMPVVWRVLLLSACVYISLLAQTYGALVISRRDAPTQETKETVGIRSMKKRSSSSANVEVQSIRITCTVSSRFAHTVMSSKALNKENSSQEIFFEVELPKMAFITNFSMEIDGQVYVGEVKEKESAKEQYEKAVSSGKTAGLVKASGRKMEKFSVSVNIAAQSSVSFILIYEELLQRTLGSYEILIRVKVEQPAQEFQIEADIYEPQGIAFVEASATFLTNELIPLVEKTVTDTKAHISFSPTVEQQKCPGCKGSLINGDFIIKYDVKRATSLGEVQAVNGYFVHFFSPPDLARVPKNVVYVIDTSGSMHGAKIEQTRESMVAILQDLHEEDHFGILLFERKISYWKDYLTKATKRNVSDAIDYVKKIQDSGSTNINSAILDAVSLLKKERKEKKVPERSMDMIFLLTDGMPNSGVTSPQLIQQNVFSAIGGSMSLFCLGFGNDVDYSFLDVMCRQNKGVARRIFDGSDAAIQLKGFYEEVSSPLLLEVDLRYSENTDFLTKTHYSQLFNGSEIVVAGQLKENDMDNFSVEVFAHGSEENFVAQGKASVTDWQTVYPEKGYIFGDFIERMWAYLTIQQQLENSALSTKEERGNIEAKALNLSLKYNFVTPLTSLVVTKPENENGANRSLIADKMTESQRQQAERHMAGAHASPAVGSPVIDDLLAAVDGDPHFMIELPDKNDALCFNINDKPGTIFSLVRDPKSGFVVNGQIISKKKVALDGNMNTYFGHFGITHQKLGVRLDVSVQEISVFYSDKQVKLLWSDATALRDANMELKLVKNCSLTVTLRHSVKFRVIRHTKVWKRRHDHQDYLGFYTLDSHHLSASVHGLLGQFYHGVVFELTDLRPGEGQEKLDATMYVKGQRLNVTRHWQKDFNKDLKNGESIACWFVDNEGRGLIDGAASDYTVSDLFTAI
ncbi:inter-alpha-trypsin inhibitor heavy chain H3 isoform X5 [Oreochromis niloticus]|uniref:inter-alpha-trypsin inhibitor heavy chain H3 isoform X5 n=1 Tax=Oreochromis niloticus TaxID=8128 RepID=UPI000DF12B53|nr:inter-alpha-trypsin inhibitor heavy chain H3 isoform X5 [Oreochromis niloticus]